MSEYKSLYGSNDINADEAYIENLEVNTLKIGRTTIQDLETTISNRQMNIPDSGENGEFVITNGDVDQIIGGDNTFTGVNSFSNPLGLKVDLISEYTLNNGVSIEGVKLKDGEITDTAYTTGVLHSDTNGAITSSLIVNDDITTNTISLSKLVQITNNNVLGNISGVTGNISTVPTATTKTANTIMLRDSSANTNLNALYTNYVGSLDNSYVNVKNISFSDNQISCGSLSDFYISNTNNGYLVLQNEVGETYLTSLIDHVNIISYGISKNIYNWNNTHIVSPNILYVDSISEESLNNGVYIDSVLLKDGLIADTAYTTGILHSDTNGVITSSSIVNADISNSAAIVYSKLSLSNSIVNADINTAAAIVYSKLSLSNSILNADINTAAAIAVSKLASGTAAQILLNNATPTPTWTSITGDVTISNTGVTAIASGVIVNADINASAAIAYSKLSLSNSIVNADINTAAAIAYSKLSLSNSIVNADINSAAAIADTKLATISTAGKVSNSATTATTSNTANTIVLRDVSGNISAVGITASGLTVNGDITQTGPTFSRIVYSNGAPIILYQHISSKGTSSVPSGLLTNDILCGDEYYGQYGGTVGFYGKAAQMYVTATQNFSAGQYGTSFNFSTCANSSSTLTERLKIDSSGLTTTGIVNALGSISAPSYSFNGDSNTGMWSSGADSINFSIGGNQIVQIVSNISYLTRASVGLGSVSAPTYTFNGDANTGVYSSGADSVDISTGGTRQLKIDSSGCYATNLSLDGLSYLGGVFKSGSLSLSLQDSFNVNFGSVVCTGTYTRMFNIVHYFFSINWNGKTGTTAGSNVRITGFPYSFSGNNNVTSNITSLVVNYTSYPTIAGVASQTYAGIYNQRTNNTDVAILVSDMPTTSTFYCQMTAYV